MELLYQADGFNMVDKRVCMRHISCRSIWILNETPYNLRGDWAMLKEALLILADEMLVNVEDLDEIEEE